MPNEYGFKFEVKGEVFIAQASKAGIDIVKAYDEAVKARTALIKSLADILPCKVAVTEPMAATRRVAEPAKEPK